MAKQTVAGQEWDIESVDGNTVTLVGGQKIEVSDATLAEINKPSVASATRAIKRRVKK